MWTRSDLKYKAKSYLKSMYLMALAVSFIMAFFGSSGPDFKINGWERFGLNRKQEVVKEKDWYEEVMDYTYMGRLIPRASERSKEIEIGPGLMIASVALVFALVFFSIGMILSIFIFNPLILGGKSFFLNAAKDRSENFGDLGFAFSGDRYWNVVKTLFFKNLYVFLWSLLLIIPGIIKGYAYSMVSYILAENPEMDYKDALELSDDLTRGHKWNIFVLDLSFIGWYFLGSLLCGVGVILVHPYYNATHAELYLALKGSNELSIDYNIYDTMDYKE